MQLLAASTWRGYMGKNIEASGVSNGSESHWVAGRFALCHGPPPSN